MGPSAVRIAGLGERLAALGASVVDKGDLPTPIPETKVERDPKKRYVREIARVCVKLYSNVRASLEEGRSLTRDVGHRKHRCRHPDAWSDELRFGAAVARCAIARVPERPMLAIEHVAIVEPADGDRARRRRRRNDLAFAIVARSDDHGEAVAHDTAEARAEEDQDDLGHGRLLPHGPRGAAPVGVIRSLPGRAG